ncbi:hypothetical protein JYB64_00190 [Algoriphagus aestuarii]|nr:hypothetical protein [Algoriphagus aestuarii]
MRLQIRANLRKEARVAGLIVRKFEEIIPWYDLKFAQDLEGDSKDLLISSRKDSLCGSLGGERMMIIQKAVKNHFKNGARILGMGFRLEIVFVSPSKRNHPFGQG